MSYRTKYRYTLKPKSEQPQHRISEVEPFRTPSKMSKRLMEPGSGSGSRLDCEEGLWDSMSSSLLLLVTGGNSSSLMGGDDESPSTMELSVEANPFICSGCSGPNNTSSDSMLASTESPVCDRRVCVDAPWSMLSVLWMASLHSVMQERVVRPLLGGGRSR